MNKQIFFFNNKKSRQMTFWICWLWLPRLCMVRRVSMGREWPDWSVPARKSSTDRVGEPIQTLGKRETLWNATGLLKN